MYGEAPNRQIWIAYQTVDGADASIECYVLMNHDDL